MNALSSTHSTRLIVTLLAACVPAAAAADAVTDWNAQACELVAEAKLGPPPAMRVMALVQTAVDAAAQAASRPTPGAPPAAAHAAATVDAAIAAANRLTLSKLLPTQQAAIDAAYQSALTAIGDHGARNAGIAIGERAAAQALAARADDVIAPEAYRPRTTPGLYVPTAIPAVPQWPQRKPWLMSSASQFRPAPPPLLGSDEWARDYNEVKAVGARNSAQRTSEQTEVARFWEYTLPSIYYGVLRSVATQPGRDTTQNAALYAAVGQAMDDGMIAVFDAKYHYNYWRPVTAIRNGDLDGNDATERDAGWTAFSDVPMHPEYPSAHSVIAGVTGALLQEVIGSGALPALTTSSPTAKGATRHWTTIDQFLQEVANARIYSGIHYRSATTVGTAMGRQIGELAAARLLRARMAAAPEARH